MAQALTASRAEFLTLLFSQEEKPDAYIDSVVLPSYLYPGDKYSITVLVESNFDTEAVLALYDGSRQTAANNVHLNKGRNRFVFSAQVNAEAGRNSMETLRVQVQAQGDTCAENDSYNAYSIVEMPPSVLVISGQETDTSGFASVLNAAGCNYSMVSALNAPNEINAMLEYKAKRITGAALSAVAEKTAMRWADTAIPCSRRCFQWRCSLGASMRFLQWRWLW